MFGVNTIWCEGYFPFYKSFYINYMNSVEYLMIKTY